MKHLVCAIALALFLPSLLFAGPIDGWESSAGMTLTSGLEPATRITYFFPENDIARLENTRFGLLVGGLSDGLNNTVFEPREDGYWVLFLFGAGLEANALRSRFLDISFGLDAYWTAIEHRWTLHENALPTRWHDYITNVVWEPRFRVTVWPHRNIGLGVQAGVQIAEYRSEPEFNELAGVTLGASLHWRQ